MFVNIQKNLLILIVYTLANFKISNTMISNEKTIKTQPMLVINSEDMEDSYLKAYREQHQFDNVKIIKPTIINSNIQNRNRTETTAAPKMQQTSKKQLARTQTAQTTTLPPPSSTQSIPKTRMINKKFIIVNKQRKNEKDFSLDQDLQTSEQQQIHYIVPKYYNIEQLLKSNDVVVQPLNNYDHAQNLVTLVPTNLNNNYHQMQQLQQIQNDVLVKNPNVQIEQLNALLNTMKNIEDTLVQSNQNGREYTPIKEDLVDIMNTASRPNVNVATSDHTSDNVAYSKTINRQQYQRQLDNTEDKQTRYASKYAFGYHVHDQHSGNDFGHEEHRDGDITRGHYHVLLPDGRVQNVKYHAGPNGYHAVVSYH